MTRSFRIHLLVAVVSIWGWTSSAGAHSSEAGLEQAREWVASELKITVHLYDSAKVSGNLLTQATNTADTILLRAGIQVAWIDCFDPGNKRYEEQLCEDSGPTHLVLRILSRSMTQNVELPEGCIGWAILGSKGAFGYIANVVYPRVDELARSRGEEELPIILGHALAHEMGHLLLGPDSHSDTGIMRIPWDRKQLDRARLSNLRFTPEQAAQIRRQVSDRMAAE